MEKLVEEGSRLADGGAGVVGPGVAEKGGGGVGGGVGAEGLNADVAEHSVAGPGFGIRETTCVAAHASHEGEIDVFPSEGFVPFLEFVL